MDYKPFDYHGRDFARAVVSYQIIKDMQKEEEQKKQQGYSVPTKPQKPRTKEQQKRDTIFCIVMVSFMALCILVTIVSLIIEHFI